LLAKLFRVHPSGYLLHGSPPSPSLESLGVHFFQPTSRLAWSTSTPRSARISSKFRSLNGSVRDQRTGQDDVWFETVILEVDHAGSQVRDGYRVAYRNRTIPANATEPSSTPSVIPCWRSTRNMLARSNLSQANFECGTFTRGPPADRRPIPPARKPSTAHCAGQQHAYEVELQPGPLCPTQFPFG